MTNNNVICRYFTTYSGVQLPFKLVAELGEHEIRNRNTYFRGYYDADGVLLSFQKIVYGEVEIEHQYTYDTDGKLTHAQITDADGEITELAF